MDLRKYAAELLGSFLFFSIGYLSVGAAGAAGLTTALLVVPFSFGFGLLAAIFAFGHISGGHFNPAISIALAAVKRFEWKDVAPYVLVQLVGAALASLTLWTIAINQKGMTSNALKESGFAANGYGDHSPGSYALIACLITEVVMTAIFLIVIMGATDKRAPKGFAGVAIGLALTLIHLVSIPVTNTSVNPARSFGPALFVQGWALSQLWLFWVAPIVGGLIGAVVYQLMAGDSKEGEGLEPEALAYDA